MSKSILLIDTPENCIGCDFSDCELREYYCERAKRYLKGSDGEESRPDWCPLPDLPEKKPKVKYHGNGCFGVNEAMKNSFNMGFNSCIDELLKGVFDNLIPYNGDNIGGLD